MSDAIKLVKKTIIKRLRNSVSFKEAKFKSGTVVMAFIDNDPSAAYWVKDNKVFAANGTAKMWSEDKLTYSPAGIDYLLIRKLIENESTN